MSCISTLGAEQGLDMIEMLFFFQIILMYCDFQLHDQVVKELIKGLEQKNPRTVAACVSSMRECLKAFGSDVIGVPFLLKAVVPLLDHRDPMVRDEVKLLVVEAYRYLEAFRSLFFTFGIFRLQGHILHRTRLEFFSPLALPW